MSTAWTLQTGGAGAPPATRPKMRRCTVKGCRRGWLTIRTRVHGSSGRAEDVKVRCAVCRRAD
ncbi:hypothetical protein ABT124_49035 [Streptomyces sp. NPDC001982]|uniref:hypothetical protein n=1 Tax=Streptomyces sp. NPDC001982 TaxID=3154405 RepID=UPI0033190741